ncbi:Interferon gamma 1 [Dissostichus eleginoides]|uniref:Interferon gamma 1 n=1 Tax=Dissostichus eleginoides TaxID=100907 RepID=A0AAD9FP57_DISEL|nr:Interferon gamma 1 [Dissostichus eleginoides]
MSSCWGSVCLLVFLGAAFVSGKPCQFVGENLKGSHEYISNVLSLKGQDVGLDPLFSDFVRSNSSLEIKVNLMNATLEVYHRIFSSILRPDNQDLLKNLSEADRKEVTKKVEYLKQKIENLTKKLGHVNHDKENILSKLQEIQVDDPLVQRKALAEFKEVFQAASVIICPEC